MDGTSLMTPRQVAGRLHVGLTTVYKLMNVGQLPFVQIGSDRRIEPSAVEAFIARQRKAPWSTTNIVAGRRQLSWPVEGLSRKVW